MSRPVYVFGQMKVKDFQEYFEQYGQKFKDILPKYNGEILSSTTKGDALQGDRFGNWTVLVKFPDRESALGFYYSEEYEIIKKIQQTELTDGGKVFLFPKVNPLL